MAKNEDVSTQTSGPANPMVTSTLNNLLGGINNAYNKGPTPVFNKGDWTGVGKTTGQSWQQGIAAANNPQFQQGVDTGFGQLNSLLSNGGFTPGSAGGGRIFEDTMGATARGDYLNGANPYFEANLARGLDDAGAGVNAAVGAGGRFGSGMHVGKLADTLGGLSTSARSGQYEMERDRQLQALQGISGERQQGIQNTFGAQNQLGSLLQSSMLPSSYLGGIGGAQDANQQAARASARDLFERQSGNNINWLGQLSSILGGAAPIGGQTTTQTTPTVPWWQQGLGYGLQAASMFAR